MWFLLYYKASKVFAVLPWSLLTKPVHKMEKKKPNWFIWVVLGLTCVSEGTPTIIGMFTTLQCVYWNWFFCLSIWMNISRTDKPIFLKFDSGDLYEKLSSYFSFFRLDIFNDFFMLEKIYLFWAYFNK